MAREFALENTRNIGTGTWHHDYFRGYNRFLERSPHQHH